MHPEVKRALDTNLSVLEVIRLFTKHHSGVPEDRIELRLNWELELRHSDFSFWDTWKPLFRKLFWYSDPEPASASEPFLSIHKNLTREIISWLCDSKRRSNIHLIAEGQTQTENASENHRGNAFATICYDAHRFGLPLRDAPRLPPGIFSLCAALATHSPPYRRILTRILIEDPKVFKLSTRTRFKKLIYEPWKTLQISHPQYVAAPPVIVLRWHDPKFWDEELLSSIYEFASPLLWIISFSPKFKLPIQDLLDPFKCPRLTRLPVCYNDAPADTKLFLHHRFNILRQKHKEMFTKHEVWPSEDQMFQLTRIFMGSFDAIDVVIYFVDWEGDGGPKAHLEKFLAYMVDSPSPSDERPYCALDYFYNQAFSAIPHNIFPVVKRILSVCCWEGNPYPVSSLRLACLLSNGHDSVLGVLPHLFRWALISHEILLYLPSPFCRSFLADAKRSGRFHIPKSEIRFLSYEASLRIIRHSPNPFKSMKPAEWFDPKAPFEFVLAMDYAFKAFYYASDTGSHSEWALLRHFDFGYLSHYSSRSSRIHWFKFLSILQELHAWDKVSSPNIVRVEPAGDLDKLFIDKCEGLAEPLELKNRQEYRELRPTGPKYVLLGLEARTVLVVLGTLRDPGIIPVYYGFSIYTSAMLDCM
ncbi:hypothetical protein Agabi119p4_2681 [Agaricus bisporus var. burnettii]|uniref:Uncharacterized protein n=1 Tax=Agaricus bisporus var. burnettii TaxID=192524 RepID=A0A8H7F9L7_AGABI|nr:hypothetical protein Agabi119p4_2681 [Agaricus bisporus var. burnettii]